MRSLKCPHCKKLLLSAAQQAVIRAARKPAPILTLAFAYGSKRPTITYLSACRAVERLAKMGALKVVKGGLYKANV